MKKILFVIAFLIVQYHAAAQDEVLDNMKTSFEINTVVLRYPKRFSNPEALAVRIRNDFKTERDRAQAIYSWMAFNIRYDVKKFRNPPKRNSFTYKTQEEKLLKQQKLFEKQVNKTLQSGKGICGDYSAVYYSVATLVGLNCEMNNGTAKTEKYDIGKKRATVDHGWNSVQIDGDWKLLDVTWGAGYLDEETDKFEPSFTLFYFDTPKELFFAGHYPEKGIWHDNQLDKKKFLDAPLIYNLSPEYKIVEPSSGAVEVHQNDKLKFKILNVQEDAQVKYSLKSEGETADVTAKIFSDNVLEFDIIIDKTIGRFLTIIINGNAIATFKVNRNKQ